MLEEIPSASNTRIVYRLSSNARVTKFLAELELGEQESDEIRDVLNSTGYRLDLEELLKAPFRKKRRLGRKTRFSDGTFPVFYSSLEIDTSEAEVKHWMPNYCGNPKRSRTVWFDVLRCRFDGIEKDIRSKIREWPDLVHESDYSFCNDIGIEAKCLGLDGLVTQSARHSGSNLPVFRRQAVSDPHLVSRVAMTYHPDSDDVSVLQF